MYYAMVISLLESGEHFNILGDLGRGSSNNNKTFYHVIKIKEESGMNIITFKRQIIDDFCPYKFFMFSIESIFTHNFKI